MSSSPRPAARVAALPLALAAAVVTLAAMDASPAGAWSQGGHRIICEIALGHLEPAAREHLEALLAADPEGSDLPSACAWSHEIQSELHPLRDPYRAWDAYHFLFIDPTADQLDLGRDCADRVCLVNGILDLVGRLRSRSTSEEEQIVSVKLLAGLVGDLHQPLHVSAMDRDAGRSTPVNFKLAEDRWLQDVSLYDVWDTLLLQVYDEGDWHNAIGRLAEPINEAEVRQWSRTDLFRWANESRALSEEETFWVQRGMGLGSDYIDTATPFLEQQLRRAGVRLAAILNRVFSEDASDTPFYVGNAYWDVYYYPECDIAKRIPQDQLRIWEDAPAGRRLASPCPSL